MKTYEIYFETCGTNFTRTFTNKAKALAERNSDWFVKEADLVCINEVEADGYKTSIACYVNGKKQK